MGNFVNNYKDLEIWKRSFNLCVSVYKVTERLPRKEVYAMADQLNRASVSVSSNIAEGYQSGSHAMFVRYLYIARGSLAEVETQNATNKGIVFQ